MDNFGRPGLATGRLSEPGATVPGVRGAEDVDQEAEIDRELEAYRRELTGYCYRMLGSAFEAEDAVQETMVRAWKAYHRFEGRSSLRSWLYRIATNVCLTMLDGSKRRARPVDLSSPVAVAWAQPGAQLPESAWVEPIPDSRVALPAPGAVADDPAERAATRDSVRLAFVAALQHLPPRQRAVLILREVLSWRAAEVAELLGTTVASVNSALQRARATLAATGLSGEDDASPAGPLSEEHHALLTRYLAAFEAYDMEALTALLHQDATLSMPPYEVWLRGPADIRGWMLGQGAGCPGSRLIATRANGSPAAGQYRPEPTGPPDKNGQAGHVGHSGHAPWGLHVLDTTADGQTITGLTSSTRLEAGDSSLRSEGFVLRGRLPRPGVLPLRSYTASTGRDGQPGRLDVACRVDVAVVARSAVARPLADVQRHLPDEGAAGPAQFRAGEPVQAASEMARARRWFLTRLRTVRSSITTTWFSWTMREVSPSSSTASGRRTTGRRRRGAARRTRRECGPPAPCCTPGGRSRTCATAPLPARP